MRLVVAGLSGRGVDRFGEERGDLSAKNQVANASELLHSQVAVSIDQSRGRRASHLVGRHRLRSWDVGRCIDGYRKREPILVDKRLESFSRALRSVVLEYRMQPENHEVVICKCGVNLLRLG